MRKLLISPWLAEVSVDLFESALDFTVHLLEAGFGALLAGDESHFYRSVQ